MKATLQIGAEAGFHGLSMSKIAKAAGVATATIYIYFENIDAIINQLYVDLKELVFGGSMTGVKPYMGSRQAFGLIWRNMYDNMLTHNVEFRFLEQFTNSPYISQIQGRRIPSLFTRYPFFPARNGKRRHQSGGYSV